MLGKFLLNAVKIAPAHCMSHTALLPILILLALKWFGSKWVKCKMIFNIFQNRMNWLVRLVNRESTSSLVNLILITLQFHCFRLNRVITRLTVVSSTNCHFYVFYFILLLIYLVVIRFNYCYSGSLTDLIQSPIFRHKKLWISFMLELTLEIKSVRLDTYQICHKSRLI